MDAFLFSLNAVFPIFLVMALGYALKKLGIISPAFIEAGTKITFTIAIPCMLLPSILDAQMNETFDLRLTLFAIITTLLSVAALRLLVPRFVKDPKEWTAYIQGAFRSNYLIIGLALSFAVGGEMAVAKASMLLVFIGPLYNLLSVLILAQATRETGWRDIWRRIYTNPVIITTTAAVLLSLLGIQLPPIIRAPINMLGNMALPLSLLTLGATISFRHAEINLPRALTASLIKVALLPLIFMPLAYLLGLRGIDLVLCLILFGSPAAISSFPMAYQMGADYKLAGMIVALSNTMSIFTLFILVFLLRSLVLI